MAPAAAPRPELDPQVAAYVEDSYPHNHDYRIVRGAPRPRRKLARRWRKLRRLWPRELSSFVDVGCSKGFFVLEAAARKTCIESLGIDVHAPSLAAAEAVRAHLRLERARFERLYLHELAERVGELGGPFQTAMLVNGYHYLYFGSGFDEHRYGDHREIFAHLRRVVSERLIFSNRLELEVCPRNVQERARRLGMLTGYDEPAIRAAALGAGFRIEERGNLGRIPLWLMTVA